MKMKKVFLSLAVIAVLFTACTKEDCNCPEPTPDNELSGDISTSVTLDASIEYKLVGTLRVKEGGTLNIPAGTTIKAESGFSKFVIVERGGKIMADGTAELPITMTSAESAPEAGDWGGLIINGYANISGAEAGTEGTTEVDPTTAYGGTNDNDNSGSLTYVKLLYTGAKSSANVEHNGLTLNGVGNGTTIENIYVAYGSDDGIEFFGGAVDVTNLLVVNSDDDMFDITQGWSGTLTNAYGIWEAGYTSGEGDPRGVESDGNLDGLGPDHVNQSDYTIAGLTIENKSSFEMHDAIKVRRGATATISNAVINGGPIKDVNDLTDSKGDAEVATSISYKVDATVSGSEVKHPEAGDADVTVGASNTGADASAFAWTEYSF
jgi:hypothetical protein